jgi:hypothetical protein
MLTFVYTHSVCPHASFNIPDAPANAQPRKSVEMRVITFTKI